MKTKSLLSAPASPHLISRRDFFKATAGLGGLALAAGCTAVRDGPRYFAQQPNLIREENAKAGTRDWMLTKTGIDPKTKYRCPRIEGYCSHTSIRAGETLKVFVSANPPSTFTLEIFRTGYYGGMGGRRMWGGGPYIGNVQPDPPEGKNRLRECRWEPALELTIPADWPSGVYVGKLTAEREGWQSYIIFIVRDYRRADFIFQCSDTTWQAYNRWPNQYALYDNGKEVWYCGPNVDVSFDRPYGKYCQILDAPLSTGSGEWFLWEFPFAYWLEQLGYDVTVPPKALPASPTAAPLPQRSIPAPKATWFSMPLLAGGLMASVNRPVMCVRLFIPHPTARISGYNRSRGMCWGG